MGDIDKDIEAASLKALTAQSRLNSTLTSVYAKAPAPPEAAAEGAAAAETPAAMAAQDGQMAKPAGAAIAPCEGDVRSLAPLSAQPSDVPALGQQRSALQAEAAACQQGAAQKEAGSRGTGTMPADDVQGNHSQG